MDNKRTIAVQMFNDKIRVMNQTQGKNLILNAQEARNLHSDIFALLAQISALTDKPQVVDEVIDVNMDGGGFK